MLGIAALTPTYVVHNLRGEQAEENAALTATQAPP